VDGSVPLLKRGCSSLELPQKLNNKTFSSNLF
jgi:hypothetical protein